MNYSEAKQAALNDGWGEADLTPAVIKQYGWTPSDPLEGVNLTPTALTEAEAKDHLAALVAEAEAGGVTAEIIAKIVQFGGLLIPLIM